VAGLLIGVVILGVCTVWLVLLLIVAIYGAIRVAEWLR
jgi:hypothetical protein